MAIRNQQGKLKGKIGDLVYRFVNGQTVVQARPAPGGVKQSAATKGSAVDFSLGSNRAKILRLMLFPMLQGMQDNKMINRLNAAVTALIRSATALKPGYRDLGDGNLDVLAGFECNVHSPFAKYFPERISCSLSPAMGITIGFAAFQVAGQLRFPEPATGLTLKILLTAVDLEHNQYCYVSSADLFIAQQTIQVPATAWNFPDDLPSGCIYVVSAALEYSLESLEGKMKLNHAHLHPVVICGLLRSAATTGPPPPAPSATGMWNHWNAVPGLDGRDLLRK